MTDWLRSDFGWKQIQSKKARNDVLTFEFYIKDTNDIMEYHVDKIFAETAGKDHIRSLLNRELINWYNQRTKK